MLKTGPFIRGKRLAAVGAALILGASAVPAVAQEVSFAEDVLPILNYRCVECHQPGGAGHEVSGLDLTSYEGVMAGTKHGPMIVPRDWLGSNLLAVIEHRTASEIWMPHDRKPLSKCEIQTIRFWVLQGAQDN